MKNLPKVRGKYFFNEPLPKYNWFGVGGKAEILFQPSDKDDLIFFLKNRPKNLKVFVIGAGSNLLIRDGGIKGVTIILKKTLNNIVLDDEGNIKAECGILNPKFLSFCKKNSIGGYEFLGTIPGTIGGGIKMNAGCYGVSVSDKLISVSAVDLNGKIKTYSNKECGFEYRKNNLPENLIFIEAVFDGSEKKSKEEIEKDLNEKIQKRKNTQPCGVKTCGCTFKNPPEIPAWKLIKDAGFQGKEIQGAKMSEKHANFMINTGTKNASDLENLGELIRKKVKEDKGIDLEWEIQRIGEK